MLYLVYGDLRIPWAYRVWRGKGTKTLSLLALRLLASLPPWIRQAFRIRVAGRLPLAPSPSWPGWRGWWGWRHDRRLQGGGRLRDRKRQGSRVYLLGLACPVWVSGYRYPRAGGGWAWRYGVATFPATGRTMLLWGRRRFSIEHFFKVMKGAFSLGQFGQRSAIGVHRFLVLSLLAYLLAHWVRVERRDEELTWRETAGWAARLFLSELVVQGVLRELDALGQWPPGGGAGSACLCRICGRCKF